MSEIYIMALRAGIKPWNGPLLICILLWIQETPEILHPAAASNVDHHLSKMEKEGKVGTLVISFSPSLVSI